MDGIEWRVSAGLTPYPEALAEMEARAAAIRDGTARELIWLLEHPPLYTAGTSAAATELLSPGRFPVYPAGRGGGSSRSAGVAIASHGIVGDRAARVGGKKDRHGACFDRPGMG